MPPIAQEMPNEFRTCGALRGMRIGARMLHLRSQNGWSPPCEGDDAWHRSLVGCVGEAGWKPALQRARWIGVVGYALAMMRLCVVAVLVVSPLLGCVQPEPGAEGRGGASAEAVGEGVAELDRAMWIVHQARDGAYWFGSDGRGVYRWDGERVVRFTAADGLASDHVRSIQEDGAGAVFVGCEPGGVSRFDGRTFTTVTARDEDASTWELRPDDLWFSGGQDTGAVYRWDGASLHRLTFPKTEAGEAHVAALPRDKFPNAKYSPYAVYTSFRDSAGRVWFGTASLGACCYDGKNFTWVGHGANGSFGTRAIVEDGEGGYWLSNCINRYVEAREGGLPRFSKEMGIAKEGDPYSVFMSAVRERDGALWLATLHGGVYRKEGGVWTHFPVVDEGAPIRVYSIYKDRRGGLWLGTQEHGVYRFNGAAFERFEP